jgi:hypothetical protein
MVLDMRNAQEIKQMKNDWRVYIRLWVDCTRVYIRFFLFSEGAGIPAWEYAPYQIPV